MSRSNYQARNQYRWYVLGMAVLGGGVTFGIILMAVMRSPQKTNIITNVMLICMGFLPMLLCLVIIFMLLVAATFGLYTLQRMARHGLQQAEQKTRTIAKQTTDISDKLSRQSINVGTRFSSLDHVFSRSDEDADESTTE
jgi:ABC-type multidrug transport system fused ATPase/permease subunit